jgi:hypothetical protein
MLISKDMAFPFRGFRHTLPIYDIAQLLWQPACRMERSDADHVATGADEFRASSRARGGMRWTQGRKARRQSQGEMNLVSEMWRAR